MNTLFPLVAQMYAPLAKELLCEVFKSDEPAIVARCNGHLYRIIDWISDGEYPIEFTLEEIDG